MDNEKNIDQEQDRHPERWTVPEIEGCSWNYFYVCSECHGCVNWHQDPCPHCGWRLNWNE